MKRQLKIELMRSRLSQMVSILGPSAPMVLAYSRRLDKVINLVQGRGN